MILNKITYTEKMHNKENTSEKNICKGEKNAASRLCPQEYSSIITSTSSLEMRSRQSLEYIIFVMDWRENSIELFFSSLLH